MTSLLDDPTVPVPVGWGGRLLGPAPQHPLPIPRLDAAALVATVRDAGLVGCGGAGFPTWRKIAAVAEGRRAPIVLANGSEGEPASGKDRALLSLRPDLVLDGLAVLSAAVSAAEVHLLVADPATADRLRVLVERRRRSGIDPTDVLVDLVPDAFLTGEETAAVRWLASGPAVPKDKDVLLVHRGLRGRPTLVQNVETLAQLALVARHGPRWFRAVGTANEPGTRLVTVTGAVRSPGVLEVAGGSSLSEVLSRAGGSTAALSAVLLGGYGGGWIDTADAARARLVRSELTALGAALGAGVIVALPRGACGLRETSRVTAYLARSSAGQCGPCLNGLPRLAELMQLLADPRAPRRPDGRLVSEAHRIAGLVEGRGACHHPNGAVRLVRSALRTFSDEIGLHLQGRCSATATRPVLPLP